jgi:hypothetical protein
MTRSGSRGYERDGRMRLPGLFWKCKLADALDDVIPDEGKSLRIASLRYLPAYGGATANYNQGGDRLG